MAMQVILIFAREPEEMNALASFLREHDFEVVIEREVSACLERLAEREIAMALVDVQQGVGEALEELAAFRAVCQALPVVLIGAECASESMVRAFERGASAFVARPVNRQQLLEYVRRVLKGVQ